MAKLQLPDSNQSLRLPDGGSSLRLPDSGGGGLGSLRLGTHYTPAQKLGAFGLSTLESFPELFGIEPTDRTQEFRTASPILGFASQLAGAFVPYVGAAKALEGIPLAKAGITAVEALGGENRIARTALKGMAEAGMIEAGRLGLSATGAPQAAYSAVTGRDADQKSLLSMAGDSAVNIAAAGVLGGAGAALAGRFAKGPNIAQIVPGAAPDQPLLKQIRALNETIAKAQDPADPFTLPDNVLTRLDRERARRIKANLLGTVPTYTNTGELAPNSGQYWIDRGKSFRPLVGEVKTRPLASFLNRAANWKGTVDKLTKTRRFIYDPLENGGYASPQELDEALQGLGVNRDTLGMYAQDVGTIEVKAGSGNQPKPKDYSSPLAWIRDKVGRVQDFYHGTNADIAETWKPGARGGVSLSTDPRFASIWAESRTNIVKDPATGLDVPKGARVYVTAIKHDPNKIGDFRKPADVLKAIEESGLDPRTLSPEIKQSFDSGYWGRWEDTSMLQKAGWDTVYMVETPTDKKSPLNIFVTNGDRIYSAFDPQVQWAKNLRLHATEPNWSKPTKKMLSAADQKAVTIQKKFTGKPFADVGNGFMLAREKGDDGLFVMAKKIKGDPLNPEGGDQWTFFRTDSPEQFAPKAAAMQKEVLRSGYFPLEADSGPIGEYMFDSARNLRRLTDKNQATKLQRAAGPVGAMVGESLNTIGTYAAPTVQLGSRNPLLARGFAMVDMMNSLADARINTYMNGEAKLDGAKSILGDIFSLDGGLKTNGFNDFLKTLSKDELAEIVNIDEASLALDKITALHQRGIVSDNVMKFFTAGQALADETVRRADSLREVVNDSSIQRILGTFKSRNAHYALTREYPGAYKYVLEDEAGHWIGTASGVSPKDAQVAASDIIAREAGRGRTVIQGGLIDEAMMSGEDAEKMLSAVRAPGFIKSRSKMIGYELARGEMTNKKISDLVARNLRMRENFFKDIALREHTKDILERLHRENPQDAIALDKRIRIAQGDEGEFAKVQNAIMDKALHAVGLSGKDSASAIVRTTQKLLGAWTFGFGSLPQVLMNLMGTFQTLMPHVSFILNASPERLGRNFVSMPLLDGANNIKGTFGALSPWKVLKNSMDLIATPVEKLDPEFKDLFETLVKRGKLAPRFMEEQFGGNAAMLRDPIAAFKAGHSFVEMANTVNQVFMTKTEEVNRSMVVAASYVLGKEAGLTGERLAFFTQEMIAQAAYNYSTVDRATMFTTPLGSLSGTFKNWIFHYMGSMIKYASAGKEGIAPLMWQTASTALIGGVAATPFVNPIANTFSQFYNGNTLMDNLYSAAGNFGLNHRVADGVMYGLPGMMGVSLSSQAQAPGSNPERDASMIFSVATLDRVRALSSGVKQALVNAAVTGETPWDDPEVRGQLIRGLAPRTIYRAMSIGGDGALKSLGTGNTVMDGLGLGDHLLYTMGFNPVDLDKTYAIYDEMKGSETKKLEAVKALGSTLSDAWANGDDRMANRTFMRATAIGVDASSVLRSAQANTRRDAQTGIEFQANDEYQPLIGSMFGDSE